MYPCPRKGVVPLGLYSNTDPLGRGRLKCEFMMNSSLWIQGEISPSHFHCAALTVPLLLCPEACGTCFALPQKNTGHFYSHFSSSLQGSEGMPLLHFLLFVQLRPCPSTLNNNSSPYLRFVQSVTSSGIKQTAAYPKTWIVFKKFRLASCLESLS